MSSSGEEKTEKPTPKRLKEAKKEGQVARTQEIGAWSAMVGVALALPWLIGKEVRALRDLMTQALTMDAATSVPEALLLLAKGGAHMLIVLVILGSGVMIISVAGSLAQGGFYLATKMVQPNFKKLNPTNGAKRIFGPQAWWEGAKMLLKSALVGFIIYRAATSMTPYLGGLVPTSTLLQSVGDNAFAMIRNVALLGLVMGGADYAFQRRRINKQVMMSKSEVKQEHKQTEGDPLVKSAIRSRQLATARNRMIADIAEADVVLVNPTHIAVALRYDADKGAPTVVARGAGVIAQKIRDRAAEERVPIVQDVPLARALHRSTQVGQEIPPELFAAVAHVLAFIISRRSAGQYGGEHRSPRPETELPAIPRGGRRRRNLSTVAPAGRIAP